MQQTPRQAKITTKTNQLAATSQWVIPVKSAIAAVDNETPKTKATEIAMLSVSSGRNLKRLVGTALNLIAGFTSGFDRSVI